MGLSLVRKVLSESLGDDWHNHVLDDVAIGKLVQSPSIIYTKLITELTGGYDASNFVCADVRGAAHITGGGLPSKLGRMLEPSGLGAMVEPDHSPKIMQYVQELGNITDREVYNTWNMGYGMVIATPEPDVVIELAQRRGYAAQHIGEVISSSGIFIRNKAVFRRGDSILVF